MEDHSQDGVMPGPQEPPRLPQPSELEKLRERLGSGFNSMVELISAIRQPLPTQTDDGKALDPKEEEWFIRKIESDLHDFGSVTTANVKDMKSILEALLRMVNGEPIDDKTYFMEILIKIASSLPEGSVNGKKITNDFLKTLWNDLEHPPQSMLGKDYVYRSADGSYNNLLYPHIGKAGMPYARTCKPVALQPGALPDPGVIFDSIMVRRPENRTEHPNRISSMLFYLASIIIHDLFRTDHKQYEISNTSSYLDLSPLYGSNEEEQKTMRTYSDGKIFPDCFAEKRLLGFPPGVSVLLIMFNRFHNYVVDNLARINENGRFNKPVETDPKYKVSKDVKDAVKDVAKAVTGGSKDKDASATKDEDNLTPFQKDMKQYDEDLFQTGRLITSGLYINIILIDYVRTILNLNRTNSKWQLNPRNIINGVELGGGNQVSAEFNLVYRWHSAISAKDEQWTEEAFKAMLQKIGINKEPKDVTEAEMYRVFQSMDEDLNKPPVQRDYAGMTPGKRDKTTGKLPDDNLVKILSESIEDSANSFGANRVPEAMRAVEILGIRQARAWNLATLNEFRSRFGLQPHREFTDINPDKEVADQLKHLYGDPDLVELYPGLVAEAAKNPMLPGSGLCPSYTVSRAVLSDAVALVRGDRFYTVDFHPKKLTNWGYSLINFDLDIDNGCVFYKLFMRAFPQHFEPNSIYAHYPLTVPYYQRIALKDLGKEQLYNYDKPKFTPPPKLIFSYAAAEKILGDKATFNVTWGKAMEFLMGEPAKNFMLSGDGPENEKSRKMMSEAMYVSGWADEIKKYYEKVTMDLLNEKSYKLGTLNQVDIIRDIANLAHVRFCAEMFMMPLKGKDRPGVFDDYQLYMVLTAVFCCVFFDLDPGSSFPLRLKAHQAAQVLGQLIQANVQEIKLGGYLSGLMQLIWPHETTLKSYGKQLIQRLLANKMDVKHLVWGHIMGTAGGMVPNQGQLLGQTLDYFFSPEGQKHLPEIRRLALSDRAEDFEILKHYVMEGSRLRGETGVFRYATRDCEIQDDGKNGTKTIKIQAGDRIMVNLRAASHDPAKFPNPGQVDLTRPMASYIHLGSGPHQCLGLLMTQVGLTSMVKVIFSQLPNLRPAVGPQGIIHKVVQPFDPSVEIPKGYQLEDVSYHVYMTEKFDSFFPFPTTLKVNWD